MKLNVLKKRTLRLEQLENRELLSATTWDNAAQADAAVAAEMASTLSEAPIDLTAILETPSTVVTTSDDVVDATDGQISLREAIQYAADGDTITFAKTLRDETIVLSTEIEITKNVTIEALALYHYSVNEGTIRNQDGTGLTILAATTRIGSLALRKASK